MVILKEKGYVDITAKSLEKKIIFLFIKENENVTALVIQHDHTSYTNYSTNYINKSRDNWLLSGISSSAPSPLSLSINA